MIIIVLTSMSLVRDRSSSQWPISVFVGIAKSTIESIIDLDSYVRTGITQSPSRSVIAARNDFMTAPMFDLEMRRQLQITLAASGGQSVYFSTDTSMRGMTEICAV